MASVLPFGEVIGSANIRHMWPYLLPSLDDKLDRFGQIKMYAKIKIDLKRDNRLSVRPAVRPAGRPAKKQLIFNSNSCSLYPHRTDLIR